MENHEGAPQGGTWASSQRMNLILMWKKQRWPLQVDKQPDQCREGMSLYNAQTAGSPIWWERVVRNGRKGRKWGMAWGREKSTDSSMKTFEWRVWASFPADLSIHFIWFSKEARALPQNLQIGNTHLLQNWTNIHYICRNRNLLARSQWLSVSPLYKYLCSTK